MGDWKSLVASCQAKPPQLTGTEPNKLRFELQYLLSIRQNEKVGCIADLFQIAGYYHLAYTPRQFYATWKNTSTDWNYIHLSSPFSTVHILWSNYSLLIWTNNAQSLYTIQIVERHMALVSWLYWRNMVGFWFVINFSL